VLSLPKRKTERKVNLISYFIFFYAAINLLLIGLLVSNVGTIVRYRSIALSLLFVVVLQAFDLIKLGLRKRQLNKNASFDSSGKKDVAIESRLKI
jgi:cell division protein FtsL